MNLSSLLPKRVTIELTNRCNRHCAGCPRNKMMGPLGDMDWLLFNKIITELPPETVIVPFFRGEPLLYPRFIDAMEQLRKFNTVQLATNGDYVNSQNRKAILATCTFISLSIHDRTVLPNRLFNDARKKGVTTQVSILDSYLPSKQKTRFIQKWLGKVDRVRVYVEHSSRGFGDIKDLQVATMNDKLPCKKPFEELVVYWDGKVGLCNHDWDNGITLGNLNRETVEDVWNGVKYQAVRVQHETGRRRELQSCKDCDYWMISYLPNKMFGELYIN